MENRSLKRQAVSGVIWTFAQQFSVQIINFIVQVILARLLAPEMFGLIAMLALFVSIGQSLMDGGMTNSLIRTKNPDQLDYSTVFVTNFLVSVGIYLLVFLIAPFIADFYDQRILQDLLRVFALSFVIRSLVAVHVARLTKEMNFKTQMKLQVPSTIIGAVIGVAMAYNGYGVWSLVWLNLSQTIVFTIQNWIFIKWRPSFVFDKRRFKYHFNFGYKLTLSGLLDTTYLNLYPIVIGKYFSPTMVGFFNQAETMRRFPVQQLSAVMEKVTYPLFSNIKTDQELKSVYKKTMKLALLLSVAMMLFLMVMAEELFLLLFGEKWLPAVPYFQILSFASIVSPLSKYNLNILKVKGRSDLFLKLEVIKKIVGVLAVFIAAPFGLLALSVSYVLVFYFNIVINMLFSGKLIDYMIWEQLLDVGKIVLIGCISFIVCFFVKPAFHFIESDFLTLLIMGILFLSTYVPLIFVFERNLISTIFGLIKNK